MKPTKRTKVAIITGGWSNEREISLKSAQAMFEALQSEGGGGYDAHLVDFQRDLQKFVTELSALAPDVALLGIHGKGAEDGVLQGILEVLGIPYTSSGVASSAITMDKVFTRMVLAPEGILAPEYVVMPMEKLVRGEAPFDFPYVIKPRDEGSSIGVSIIHNQAELAVAAGQWVFGRNRLLLRPSESEFLEGEKSDMLVERYIHGREIQVAVLNGRALGLMEIRPNAEFFDYKSKYTPGGAQHILQPDIPPDVCELMLKQSEQIFEKLECRGVIRTEFIYEEEAGGNYGRPNRAYLLEVNSQPGMTTTSIVPDIARASGLSYFDLIDAMIACA
jgi:D-alanine-D-alanine ligase